MKLWSAIAATALMLGSLAACGGEDTSAYCNNLKEFQAEAESMQDSDQQDAAKAMDNVTSKMEEVADSAPEEIEDDWKTLSAMLSGELNLSGEGDGEQISPDEIQNASENIVQHAKDTCDIDLESVGN